MSLYAWMEDWAELPHAPLGWMHSGATVVGGEFVACHPEDSTLLFYGLDGTLRRTLRLGGFLEPHGFEPVPDGVWIADPGSKQVVHGPEAEIVRTRGRVALVDGERRVLRELEDPGSGWSPTAAVVVEESGDVWVADGYGDNLVHRFSADGEHLKTLTGDEGAGRFSCPHGLLVDRRRRQAELYIADRANGRIQVYDLEGTFLRTVGAGAVVTPTDMTVAGDELALTDFTQARVTILGADDELVEHVAWDPGAPQRDAWPNARDADGNLVPPPLAPGRFNSPHTLAADADGNLYVTEWMLGGRLTKLARAAAEV
jgi:hypothetical protein